ncbi:MAG: substrate binding domain-containing protein [Hyphomicrobiales bacterium]|nr:substrate binding domain-containing protein [Hyphomicrobiales bacterium]
MPAFGERNVVHRAVWSFARTHPMVAISLEGSDTPIDLVKDGFDVAIRLGLLKDSAMKSQKLGEFYRKVVCSPSYLYTRPQIRTLEDLQYCDFISIAMLPDRFQLLRGEEQVDITPQNIRLEVNSISAAKSAVMAGLGIQHLPMGEIQDELAGGELVHILPEWYLPVLGIYAVWPENGPQKFLTKRFIDALAKAIRS